METANGETGTSETGAVRFDQVLDRIRAFADARGWKPARLAREAGLSETVTRGMERPGWAPSGASVRRLEGLIPEGWASGQPLPPATPALVDDSAASAAASGEG